MADIRELRSLINTSSMAKAFFDQLATRVKNYRVTTVDHAIRITSGGRKDVVELFKQMENLELGSFIVGRRNGVSRFEWSVGMVETAQAAFGELDDIEPLDRSDLELDETPEDEDDGVANHSFVLRRNDPPITFTLPSDLKPYEAERLSKFILALPIVIE